MKQESRLEAPRGRVGALMKWAIVFVAALAMAQTPVAKWQRISSRMGELPVPGESRQQTGALIVKVDPKGGTDFILSFRQVAPALVWYRHQGKAWTRYVVEKEFLTVEAGGAAYDIDGDGDLDIVFGGDYKSDALWWWENPAPNFDPNVSWKRHTIKSGGAKQHHDQIFADLKGTGRAQLIFWNQGAKTLFLAEIPKDPRTAESWPLETVFSGTAGEGLDAVDVDGDGRIDLLAGNYWFQFAGGKFQPRQIAPIGGRIRAGRFIKGSKQAQVVIAPGDGSGPLKFYRLEDDRWVGRDLLDREMIHGHTLDLGDLNGDGNLDILAAEMAKWTGGSNRSDHPEATAWVLYGDGQGNFRRTILVKGEGWHEGKIADLNGDGRLDILNKPYTWDSPRVDIWLNRK